MEAKEAREWDEKVEKIAGTIFLSLSPDERVHINGLTDDPFKMYTRLCETHLHKQPGTRFNAYDDLFNVRKEEAESLQSLIARVSSSMHRIKDLRPDFTLPDNDNELEVMTLIRALPDDYQNFSSALLLKDNLTKSAVIAAFKNEETNRIRRSDAALFAYKHSLSPASSNPTKYCDVCEMNNHTLSECNIFRQARSKHAAERQDQKARQNRDRKPDRKEKAKSLRKLMGHPTRKMIWTTLNLEALHPQVLPLLRIRRKP